MKVLVIGGAGYIGSHVVREFLDQGYAVTVSEVIPELRAIPLT